LKTRGEYGDDEAQLDLCFPVKIDIADHRSLVTVLEELSN